MVNRWFKNEDYGAYPRRGRRKIHRGSGLFQLLFGEISITGWLIILNIIFFILAWILLLNGIDIDWFALNSIKFIEQGQVWTLLTSMFTHVAVPHLLINMFVLFSLGGLCEKIIGRKRFLWFYILGGLFAGLLHALLTYFFGKTELASAIVGSPSISAVGASGAIFAIAGLFVILSPRLKFYIIFLPFFAFPAYLMIPLVLFLTWIVSSSIVYVSGATGGIGNVAHFGGFLVGIFYGLYLKNRYKRKTKMISDLFSG